MTVDEFMQFQDIVSEKANSGMNQDGENYIECLSCLCIFDFECKLEEVITHLITCGVS